MNRIKELRRLHNLKQIDLCKQVGITQGALSGWENGKYEPDITSLNKMAEIFNVTVDYLLGNSNTENKGLKVPVLGRVQAGIPIEAVEDIIDYEEISQEMAATGEFFALQIKGDSMEPRIKEKDVVIVRRQSDVESGDVAVVLVDGRDATVKKLVKHENGISLVPFNSAYSPMFYTCSEIEKEPIIILGKVVELRGKF